MEGVGCHVVVWRFLVRGVVRRCWWCVCITLWRRVLLVVAWWVVVCCCSCGCVSRCPVGCVVLYVGAVCAARGVCWFDWRVLACAGAFAVCGAVRAAGGSEFCRLRALPWALAAPARALYRAGARGVLARRALLSGCGYKRRASEPGFAAVAFVSYYRGRGGQLRWWWYLLVCGRWCDDCFGCGFICVVRAGLL